MEGSNLFCVGSNHCLQLLTEKLMSNVTQTASITLGAISVFVWIIAEIPQVITNYREKSNEGLSVAFLMTWLIGDLFNIVGCLMEPATLPTQLYTAVLYTVITILLCSQAIYYGHIYPRLILNRQPKVETLTSAGQNKSGTEKAIGSDQSNGYDGFNKGISFSSPIPFPVHTPVNSPRRESYYQSARYLSKSHSPKAKFITEQRISHTPHVLNPIEEPLLGSATASQSTPVLNIKTTLCLCQNQNLISSSFALAQVSTLTFLGAFNLLQSPDGRIHSMVSTPKHEFVIYVGRKLLQVSGDPSAGLGAEGHSLIGTLLGWAMAIIYMSGRLPQICLNMKRGSFEGVSPLMFLFALVGNGTYIASILVRSLNWSRISPNLPWLVESGGCFLLDSFILMQFLYFHYSTSRGLEKKYKHQSLA
ncbi:hypothetical protein Lalb_Chr06g0174231 [Lupinus albus]|uniref:Uncharacterized protein n=1 Tax=Lupinus albus TaxID=3870 RepID=A0A6A4QE15_LUPAL|nr:hypothetical protein Lalb_Chr06g0174231 [Lupinus albus]